MVPAHLCVGRSLDQGQRVDPKALEAIVKKAGSVLIEFYTHGFKMYEKEPLQLVTDADVASEKLLISELQKLLPDSAIWAEESGKIGASDYCWVIDPLDGTNNFGHHIGYFCISIALMYRDQVIQAAIYQPVLDEYFYAALGQGAYLNDNNIQAVGKKTSPLMSFAYLQAKDYKSMIDVIPFPYTFRHLGASALDMAYVACGRIDGMISQGLFWWDIAAGSLLVTEAQGRVVDFQGKPITLSSSSCMAMNKEFYSKVSGFWKLQDII